MPLADLQKQAPEGAGAALQEREKVRELLKAAQEGDLDAFKVLETRFCTKKLWSLTRQGSMCKAC